MLELPNSKMDRRDFLKASGSAGLFLFFTINGVPGWAAEAPKPAVPATGSQKLPEDFNAYLHVGTDGRVTCYTGKVEMGQGVHTSLQQMLAEEMDVTLESVDIVMGDTSLCPWDRGTFGSMTTRFFGPALRKAGAEARQVLLEMASERLKLPVEKLTVEKGIIHSTANRRQKVTYSELTHGQKIERAPAAPVKLKHPGQFKIMNKGAARKDGPEKVTGAAKYTADIILPGMLYAKILRASSHGSKLVDVDFSEAEKIKGVKVIRENDFVAVLHERPDIAATTMEKVKARFSDPSSTANEKTIFDQLLKAAPSPKTVLEKGNLQQTKASSIQRITHTYFNDYVAHAAIEPHAAVVKFENGEATVWASTQTPFLAQEKVALELGIAKEKVRVMPVYIGGGFGGKSNYPQIVEAARCARLCGKPVQVSWSREEEFFLDTFRPAAIVKIDSGLAVDGKIDFWDFQVYYAGDRGAEGIYEVPNARVQSYGSVMEAGPNQVNAHPFSVGPWRAPGNNTNTFARESQMDCLAEMAKSDPVEFRLKHLSQEKQRHVLKLAAEKFGWAKRIGSSGKGQGISCAFDAGTFVATMAAVEVDRKTGEIQVKRVICVQDMGLVINPRGAHCQMEGSIIMGLGYALKEMVHFKNGQIQDTNFGTYEIPRFSWLPKIETHIIEDNSAAAEGGGEPSIVNMGAVIANAVYDAIGARLYQLPLSPERVLAALS